MGNLSRVRADDRLMHPVDVAARLPRLTQQWGFLLGLGILASGGLGVASPAIALASNAPDMLVAQSGSQPAPLLLAQATYPARQDPLINDYATLIEPQDAEQIRAVLQQLRSTYGIEATVVTVPSIATYGTGDATVEAFATRLFNTWGVGDAQRNDGVLVLLSLGDRTVRIELGRGYSSAYDARMKTVIDEYMLPHFRNGSYSFGLRRGVEAMVDPLTGSAPGPIETIPAVLDDAPLATGFITLLLGGGLMAGVMMMGWKVVGYVLTPNCPNCQVRMKPLDAASARTSLDAGQRLELELKSVIHSVCECPSCHKRTTRNFPMPISPYKPCPQCHYKTIKIEQQTTTRHPTRHSSGEALAQRRCRHCNHTDHITVVLPRIQDHHHSSSSGGSSGGGGSSSGGGASGRW